jgi:hypothetical protein
LGIFDDRQGAGSLSFFITLLLSEHLLQLIIETSVPSMETDMTDMPLDELKQATLAKVQEMVQDQSGNPISPR